MTDSKSDIAPALSARGAATPWWYVPTLYFAEGLPYILINSVSVLLYKRLGVDNARIALWTSWLYLPWVLKMFWSPYVDMFFTKRKWAVYSQFAMACALFLAAAVLPGKNFFFPSLLFLGVGAFISATHDVAVDGFYMLALTPERQAFFTGVRSAFYRLAMITGSGLLVVAAGSLEIATGNSPLSWAAVLAGCAAVFLLLFVWHRIILPSPETAERPSAEGRFSEIFNSYFSQKGVIGLVLFILFYRFAEAMLMKLAQPFLVDPRLAGGMGLTTSQVGIAYGTVGVACLVAGGLAGGWLISRYGLKKTLWPLALAMNLPDVFYVYMAYSRPPASSVFALVALEQFGAGLGFSAFTVCLMYACGEKYKTSHFAISTGIMAAGMMLPGMISGKIQQLAGYPLFFIIVCAAALPGMLTIFLLPASVAEKPAA